MPLFLRLFACGGALMALYGYYFAIFQRNPGERLSLLGWSSFVLVVATLLFLFVRRYYPLRRKAKAE